MIEAGLEHVAGKADGALELLQTLRHAQHVAVADGRACTCTAEIHVLHGRTAIRHHALELHGRAVGARVHAAGERNEVRDGLLVLDFVDSGPPHLAIDRYPGADRRHEDRVAGLEPQVAARVAAQQ